MLDQWPHGSNVVALVPRRIALPGLLLAAAACATIEPPHRQSLASADAQVRACAEWFKALDATVSATGVGDIAARRVRGFPYLRSDRFTAALAQPAMVDAPAFAAWIDRMRALAADARRVEITNLPEAAIEKLGVSERSDALARSAACADRLAAADLANDAARGLLATRTRVDDDYSAFKRTLGFYPVARLPFLRGVEGWQREATQTVRAARAGESPQHPLLRYVPPAGDTYSREEVAALLERAAANPLGVPDFSRLEYDRLFATFAPALEVETTGDYDRIGALRWGASAVPEVDIAAPTVYRKLAYTRVAGRTLVQVVYVAWMPERPKRHAFDLLGGRLDGIVWRTTLAADGEPVLFDTIHPCGCFHMFFPTPRARPVPAPRKFIEWAFVPAQVPALPEGARLKLQARTGTHYLRDVAIDGGQGGIRYAFADYDELRTLPVPGGGTRSAFAPDGLVPGTARAERFLFWPMGVASAGAMRQWGTHATAFIGRRHFDDADLIERRFMIR